MKTLNLRSTLARRTSAALLLLSITSLLTTAAVAAVASPSELLERGIYSEETKGDVDAAMKLYQQVIEEGKAGQAVAAQAQYRLGICYYKKKNYAEANAAFQKLIADYPDQKDLIALANKYLASAMPLLPAPWVDGEEMRLDIKFPTGYKLGTAVYRVRAGEAGGRKTWQFSTRLFAGTQQSSRVEAEAESLKPIHCWWKINLMGEVDVSYFPGYAELRRADAKEPKKVDLNGVVYDNEEAVQLIRRLPLASDYQTTLRIFTGLGGGNIISLGVKVVGEEKVETPAGTFDSYKVELSPVGQTFWWSTDEHHYLVKFEAGGVIAELSQVSQHKAGEPVQYRDAKYGFSLTAPADWVFFRADSMDEKDGERVLVLDPEAVATTVMNIGSRAVYGPKAGQSLREWAEKDVVGGEAVKTLKALKIRPESWKEQTAAGLPAMSVLGDLEEGKEKKVGYAVFMTGKVNSVVFTLIVPEKDFEVSRPEFEAIVDSYKDN